MAEEDDDELYEDDVLRMVVWSVVNRHDVGVDGRVNKHDVEALVREIRRAGFRLVDDPGAARDDDTHTLPCGCVGDGYQTIFTCERHAN